MPNQSNSIIAPAPEARELLERAIECLIALLDLQEGDAEKEPTLGWPDPARHVASGTDQSSLWPEVQDGDNEPSLGWSDWESRSGRYELLPEPDLEEQQDAESSLGWQNEGSQKRLRTSRDDREEQCEDEGAEHDGREPEDYSA